MLEVKNLTKSYGSKRAVDNISFTVERGEILGFLGPNGAGKSTTMNMITGYLASTSGTALIDGFDILTEPIKAKAKIGYLPEKPPLYPDMTVREYLGFIFDLKKVKQPKKQHIAEICELVRITNVFDRLIKNLSKGYCQRVGIAQALLGNPDLLILDEPTVGLDPKQIIEIRDLIKTLGKRQTVILSSHILPEVQAVCERVIVINRGILVADDTPDHLARVMSSDHKLTVRIDGPEQKVFELLSGLPHMLTVTKMGQREDSMFEYTLEAEEDADVRREMFFRLAERNWPLMSSRSSEMSLEDIFLTLTNEDRSGSAQGMVLSAEEEAAVAQALGASEGDKSEADGAQVDAPEGEDNQKGGDNE